jgi:hypothetical protein
VYFCTHGVYRVVYVRIIYIFVCARARKYNVPTVRSFVPTTATSPALTTTYSIRSTTMDRIIRKRPITAHVYLCVLCTCNLVCHETLIKTYPLSVRTDIYVD